VRTVVFYVTAIAISTFALVFELLAGTVASYLMGESVLQFATVTGAFLTAMGVGAWLTRHVESHLARRFVDCQLATAVVGGLSSPLLFVAFAHSGLFRVVLYGTVSATGVFVGAQLPLLLRLLARRLTVRDLIARILTVDYAGALVGSLLFALVLLPRLGMMASGILSGVASAACALASTWIFASSLESTRPLRIRATVVFASLACAAGLSRVWVGAADDTLFSDPVIFATQTAYQRIVVTRGHGGVNLFLDGNLQFAAADEYRYHEALVHPAFAAAKRHARVLVLGGGDGLATREILRYPDVESVTLVDLDKAMTDLCRTLPVLRELNEGSLDAPRVHVVNDDAMVWLAESADEPRLFDVVIVDFPDPNNFALGKLYTTRFYRLLRARMSDDAVAVVQSTSPLAARRSFWCIASTIESAGFVTRPYHAHVPSFGEWGYVLATPRAFGALGAVPAGLRYVSDANLASLFLLSPDMSALPVERNRLNNQVLVRYYEEEWQRWLH
jgi:spermidine synthase